METFKGLAIDDGVIKCETVVSHGKEFHEAILEEASKRNVDLIMIGRRPSSAISRLIFGSVTSKLLRYIPCNVLIVPLAALIQWKNIVLAIDGYNNEEATISEAVRIAKIYGSNLTAVSVSSSSAGLKDAEENVKRVKEYASREGIIIETISASGKPSDFILNLAKEKDSDVIITGSPEKGGGKYFLYGSFTEQIIAHSLCAVLVVKK